MSSPTPAGGSARLNSSGFMAPSSALGSCSTTGSMAFNSASPASVICVHTTRRSRRSRRCRASLSALEPTQKPRDIGLGGNHAAADGGAGQPLRMSAAQNPQNVVLRGRDAPAANFELKPAVQAIGGTEQIREAPLLPSWKRAPPARFRLSDSPCRLGKSIPWCVAVSAPMRGAL